MTPIFQHPYTAGCKFLGHFFGLDVHYYSQCMFPSLCARWGNKLSEYSSIDLKVFLRQITDRNSKIRLISENIDNPDITLVYQDYLFSSHVSKHHKAYLLALATNGVII